MTEIVDFDDLVRRYVDKVKAHLSRDPEYAYAIGFIDALTDPTVRHSNTARLQHARAAVAAVEQVRTERAEVLV
jgi:hypothetical protein